MFAGIKKNMRNESRRVSPFISYGKFCKNVIGKVITSAAFIILTTFISVYHADRPRSGAKEFILENYARQRDTRFEIKYPLESYVGKQREGEEGCAMHRLHRVSAQFFTWRKAYLVIADR